MVPLACTWLLAISVAIKETGITQRRDEMGNKNSLKTCLVICWWESVAFIQSPSLWNYSIFKCLNDSQEVNVPTELLRITDLSEVTMQPARCEP